MDADAGFFAARGSQRVLWVQVASDQPALAGWPHDHRRRRVSTPSPRPSTWRSPSPTSRRRPRPARLPGLGRRSRARRLGRRRGPRDASRTRRCRRWCERGLRNYLAGSAPNLAADLAPTAEVTLPTVSLARPRASIASSGSAAPDRVPCSPPSPPPTQRGGTYALAYELGIAYRERPYLTFIEVVPTAG